MENDYQKQIDELVKNVKILNDEIYRNNFSAHQDFNKSSNFTTKLKIPHYTALPILAEVGEVIEVGGKMYICSTPNSWSVVGTQS